MIHLIHLIHDTFDIDIDNIFFTIGDKIIRQTLWIPMGSPASPAMAIALCMYCEHLFQESNPDFGIIQGHRYVDDLIAFLNRELDEDTVKKLEGIYPPPLELESEKGILKEDGVQECKFLQSHNTLYPSGELVVIEHHKNTHRKAMGLREIKNVVHFDSHIPYHQKFGRVVGALTGAYRHSIGEKQKRKAASIVLDDFLNFGMSKRLALETVNRMALNTGDIPVWLPIYEYLYDRADF